MAWPQCLVEWSNGRSLRFDVFLPAAPGPDIMCRVRPRPIRCFPLCGVCFLYIDRLLPANLLFSDGGLIIKYRIIPLKNKRGHLAFQKVMI